MSTPNKNINKVIIYNPFTAYLKDQLATKGISDNQVRETLGIDPRTWKKRKQNPGTFTLEQIHKISVLLNAPRFVLIELALN